MGWEEIAMWATRVLLLWVLWELGRAIRASAREQGAHDPARLLRSMRKMKKLMGEVEAHLTLRHAPQEQAHSLETWKEDGPDIN